jgi:hypothetical protein
VKRKQLARALSCALSSVAAGGAFAQDANQAALQLWAQSVGAEPPAVVKQPDGTTRLSWQVQTSTDTYGNRVNTAGDAVVNSPLQTGDHHKAVLAANLRADGTDGGATFLQAAMLASNDRAVLSKYNNQVTTFQVGRQTGTYQALAGDVAANYSPLSSNLGLRGVMGKVKLDKLSFSAHMGTVAESWEAIANRDPLNNLPARATFLRDVFGVKLDYEAMPGLRFFATTQGFNDRPGSLSVGPAAIKAAETTSSTVGATWQIADLQLTSETATSRFGLQDENKRNGDATVLAALLRKGAWSWRAGYNDIAPTFVSLAAAAAPGVNEGYVGFDWQTTPNITLGLELRTGSNRTAETEITTATKSPFDAVGVRAAFNLNGVMQGLNAQLQDMHSRSETPFGQTRKQGTTNLNLNLARQGWNLMLGAARSDVEDRANPAGDSITNAFQVGAARQWMGDPRTGAAWSASLSGNANAQRQRITLTGQETESRNLGLNFVWQHPEWGSVNLGAQFGTVTQPTGGPDLKQYAYQADATYPITKAAALKAYWRRTERNAGVDTLKTVERLGGANFILNF